VSGNAESGATDAFGTNSPALENPQGGQRLSQGEQTAQAGLLQAAHPGVFSSTETGPEPARSTSEDEMIEEQAPQWIKSILPQVASGWWDVRSKGTGVVIKFRWRAPSLQTLTLLQMSGEDVKVLREAPEEITARMLRHRLISRLHLISLDPRKRDKALLVAGRMQIDLDAPLHPVHPAVHPADFTNPAP
jgi:hypothetical protein